MIKISTLNKISPAGLNRLGENYTIVENIDEASGIIVRSQNMKEMDFSDNLLAIARAGAGVNNIPLEKCADKGIVVFNTPGANANAVKELVIAGMLMSSRNIASGIAWAKTLTENVSKSVEKGKSQFAGSEISGKTLGVVGLGAIGVQVANIAEQLGMKVIGYDPYITVRHAHNLSKNIAVFSDLAEMLPKCDFITLHIPVLESTEKMIDERRFSQMKDGAILLNYSRDKLVNEPALKKALNEGKLKKYVTDFPNDVVANFENVIMTPHLGASTAEAENNCAVMAAEELMDYIENGNITNSVNYPNCSMGVLNHEAANRICIANKNEPNILNAITGVCTQLNITIRNLTNKSKGDYSYTMLDVNSTVDVDAFVKALDVEGIIRIRVI